MQLDFEWCKKDIPRDLLMFLIHLLVHHIFYTFQPRVCLIKYIWSNSNLVVVKCLNPNKQCESFILSSNLNLSFLPLQISIVIIQYLATNSFSFFAYHQETSAKLECTTWRRNLRRSILIFKRNDELNETFFGFDLVNGYFPPWTRKIRYPNYET